MGGLYQAKGSANTVSSAKVAFRCARCWFSWHARRRPATLEGVS